MQRDRFWFGAAMLAAPMVFLVLTISPGVDLAPSGPIEGHVSISGHPMNGGFILLVPEDRSVGSIAGRIDARGNFRIEPRWTRAEERGETRFRICLTPGAGPITEPTGLTELARVAVDLPQQVGDPRTSPLEVQLDSGPAWVDIAL